MCRSELFLDLELFIRLAMQFLALFLANFMECRAAGALMCSLGASGKATSYVCCCTVQRCSFCGW